MTLLNALFVQATIWHGTVIRGDLNSIMIGAQATIHENCVIHAARYVSSGYINPLASLHADKSEHTLQVYLLPCP